MSCQHGNWPPCDLCDEIDAAYEAGKKSALSQPAPQGVADKYAGMYMALADAMGYDSGKDGMEFSPEEFAAALVQERDALKSRVAELEGDVARDAARYRWLRDIGDETFVPMAKRPGCNVEMIDKAVDAAIASAKEPNHDV